MTTLTTSAPVTPTSAPAEKLILRYVADADMIAAKGRSTGLEVLPAYSQLIEKASKHFEHSNKLNCYFHLSVINASTTKLLFNLFSMLTKETRKGNQVTIYWVVEQDDEDLIDVGLDFKNALNLDFRITVK